MYQNINSIKGVTLDAVEEVQLAKNIFSAEVADTISGTSSYYQEWHNLTSSMARHLRTIRQEVTTHACPL